MNVETAQVAAAFLEKHDVEHDYIKRVGQHLRVWCEEMSMLRGSAEAKTKSSQGFLGRREHRRLVGRRATRECRLSKTLNSGKILEPILFDPQLSPR